MNETEKVEFYFEISAADTTEIELEYFARQLPPELQQENEVGK
jgi:hypothetical protein